LPNDYFEFESLQALLRGAIEADALPKLDPIQTELFNIVLEAKDAEDCMLKLRRVFHRFPLPFQVRMVEGAFDDPTPTAGIFRQLVHELPDAEKQRILGGSTVHPKPQLVTPPPKKTNMILESIKSKDSRKERLRFKLYREERD
jgi:hypothetical protein